MSQFREALGLKKMYGPRTLKRFERNERLREIARKGYSVVDVGTNPRASSTKPRPPSGHDD